MKLIQLPTNFDALSFIASNLDQLDVLEWYYASGPDIQGSLQHAVLQSEGNAWVAALVDPETDEPPLPVALFGVVKSGLASGAPWAVMTDEARGYPREVLDLAQRFVAQCRHEFDTLHIRVWGGHVPAMRFIEHLGFTEVDDWADLTFSHYEWVADDV